MWDWTPIREWLDGLITPYWSFPLLTLVQAAIMTISLIVVMAFYTLAERKIIGFIQARKGPNRINIPLVPSFLDGWVQPFADVIKLMFKEIIIPADSNGVLFRLAPFLALIPALSIWAVIPLRAQRAFANIDAGLLYVLALTSVGVYGIILAGWAANSKYAFLGAMRSAAQIVAYEIAMGFAMVGVLMAAGSLNISDIINGQRGLFGWYWTWLFPLLGVYFISGVAETNRAPFDVAEGESEIVAGFHVDYSGMAFALFFVAEYVNMILISTLTTIFFFGGWLSPLDGWINPPDDSWLHYLVIPGFWWLAIKTAWWMFVFLWLRATFPRYRYDQIMRLGWKALIPVTLIWLAVEGVMVYYHVGPWKGHV
jgi:NADH-quinone oxidoreductase subunit H